MGTAVGSHVFVRYGWQASAGLNMAWYGFGLLVLLARGPHCSRYTWFGYEGGLEARKSVFEAKEKRLATGDEKSSPAESGDLESNEASSPPISQDEEKAAVDISLSSMAPASAQEQQHSNIEK